MQIVIRSLTEPKLFPQGRTIDFICSAGHESGQRELQPPGPVVSVLKRSKYLVMEPYPINYEARGTCEMPRVSGGLLSGVK